MDFIYTELIDQLKDLYSQGQWGVQYLAKGHSGMQTGGAGDQTTGLLVGDGLSPEPQLTYIYGNSHFVAAAVLCPAL